MRLQLIHLSDIHFRTGAPNPVNDRALAIAAAAHSSQPNATDILLIVSGDVAFSGRADEYGIAREFFTTLNSALRRQFTMLETIKMVLVPGNHDCYLGDDQTARNLIRASLTSETLEQPSILSTMAEPQTAFFDFARTLTDIEVLFPGHHSISHFDLEYEEHLVRVSLVNSALCTANPEDPGTLLLGTFSDANPRLMGNNALLSLIVAHHPLHWLSPSSMSELRSYALATKSLVLTGHEHTPNLFEVSGHESRSQFIEGGVLQEMGNLGSSSFHTISVDPQENGLRHQTHKWRQSIYVSEDLQVIPWNAALAESRSVCLSLSSDTAAYLEQFEDPFVHPNRQKLMRNDLFVMPSLCEFSEVLKKEKRSKDIQPNRVLQTLRDCSTALVTSESRGGKTSLLKSVFQQLWRDGELPLYTTGDQLRTSDSHQLRRELDARVKDNYKVTSADEYFNLPQPKTLLVDDWQSLGRSHQRQDSLLAELGTMFDRIILFSATRPHIDDLVDGESLLSNLCNLKQFKINSFGHEMRSQLIYKWVFLGSSPADDEDALHEEQIETEKLIDDLLGSDLVPRTPFHILSLLTALNQGAHQGANLGSLGYLYDLLVRTSLARAVPRADQIQIYDQFLADLAHGMYVQRVDTISRDDFKIRCEEYSARFLVDVRADTALKCFADALLLTEQGGIVYFRYKYVFCLFVAKFMSQRLSTEPGRQEVYGLVRHLEHRDSASIYLFLCHCTSDPFVSSSVLEIMQSLFKEWNEVDIEENSGFLDKGTSTKSASRTLRLGKAKPEDNRQALLRSKDVEESGVVNNEASEVAQLSYPADSGPQSDGNDVDSNFSNDISRAIRTLEISGQILRNHPTSIEGDVKLGLVDASASLVKRILSHLFHDMEESRDVSLKALESALVDSKLSSSPAKAKLLSEQLFAAQVEMITVGFIEVFASNLGSARLSPVFRKRRTSNQDVTSAMLDLAAQLENPRGFPEPDALALEKRIKKKGFAWQCLSHLVYIRLYLYRLNNTSQRHRICDKFAIDHTNPQLLDPKN